MPLSNDEIHSVLLGLGTLILVIVSLILVLLLNRNENYDYSTYGQMPAQPPTVKTHTYEPTILFPNREQIFLSLSLHPNAALQQQIDLNYGQLDRIKAVIEEQLANKYIDKEYHIEKIELREPVDDSNGFRIFNHVFPVNTYGVFHFRRKDTKKNLVIPLISQEGPGMLYTTVYSMIDADPSPLAPIL